MNLKRFDVLLDNKLSIIRLYLFLSFCFFCWGAKVTKANTSSLRSFHIIRKEKCSKSKQVSLRQSKEKREMRCGETFPSFSFLGFGFGVQSDRKLNGRRRNVRFFMKRKEQYGRIAFCLKLTQLFILSYLTTPWKMLLYPVLDQPCFILF